MKIQCSGCKRPVASGDELQHFRPDGLYDVFSLCETCVRGVRGVLTPVFDHTKLRRELAERLRDAMLERLVTQVELTTKGELSKGQLSRILSGERLPQLDTILKIASALAINPTWLAFGIGRMEELPLLHRVPL